MSSTKSTAKKSLKVRTSLKAGGFGPTNHNRTFLS
jgi:hypothetical protein